MSGNRRLADQPDDQNPEGEAQETLGATAEDEVAKSEVNESTGRAEKRVLVEPVAAQRDEYLEMLQRLQAEFENYRKRTVRQQTDLLHRASEGLIEKLLPVLDALDLALAHAESDATDGDQLKKALAQIDALMRKILAQEGLERIDESGVAFDPAIHDAVAHEPAGSVVSDEATTGKVDHGRVSEIMRAGYRLHGRVLRPAMVKVEG
ncbi:MAG: nucleotide exchange factor GrpE [Acidimicrobiales bacterium]